MYKLIKLTGFFQDTPSCSGVLLNLSKKNQPTKCLHKEATLFPNQHMRNITCKLFFLASIYGLLGLQQAYAATYYVSPTGIDSNNGTEISTPVKTINRALNMARSNGDIVYVMTGIYTEELNVSQSGITLSAYQDNKPVIDGGSTLPSGSWRSLINVTGNYNTISGFEVKNCNIYGTYKGGFGVLLEGRHNTVSKMNVHHIWETGIYAAGDYNTVEDSLVWQSSKRNSTNTGQVTSGWAAGLSAGKNPSASALKPRVTSYATFRRNTVFNNWGEGLSCYETDRCTIEDNIVYDNWTMNLYLSDATNSLVQRNMVYVSSAPAITTRSSSHPGITLADEVTTASRSTNNTIINNFIYNANFNAFSWSIVSNSGLNNVMIANNTIIDGALNTGGGGIINTNSQIINNIILGVNSSVPSKSGITFSNNNWAMTPSLAAAVTDIVGDPQIARAGATTPGDLTPAYFTILGNSPVINTAMPLNSVTVDFFQLARGTAPDIGGHEFYSAADSTAPSAPSGLSATISSSKVNLIWNKSIDNVSVTGYRIYKNGTEIGTSVLTSFTDTPIAGTTNNYTIKAYDDAGNLSVLSNTATIYMPQVQVVNITSRYVGNITAKSARINWTTNIPATAVISYSSVSAYNVDNNPGLQVTVGNSATSQSVQLTNLYNNTRYYYKISVKSDAAIASSSVSEFITKLK